MWGKSQIPYMTVENLDIPEDEIEMRLKILRQLISQLFFVGNWKFHVMERAYQDQRPGKTSLGNACITVITQYFLSAVLHLI